jgi:hypothetical protein
MQSKPVNGPRKSNSPIPHAATSLPNDIETLRAMLMAECAARLAAESEAQNRALLIEKLKSIIKKLRHEQFGQSAECGPLWKAILRKRRPAPTPCRGPMWGQPCKKDETQMAPAEIVGAHHRG